MALPIPCTPDDVTDQWLEQLLRDHHGNAYRLGAVTPVSMVANQVSYCSEMLSVECTGRLGDEQLTDHLLVKLLPREATIRALVTKLNMVQCETWVYRDLLPRLCRFEATRRRRAVAEMTASCLLADIEHSYDDDGDGGSDGDGSPRCVIVLENLQPSGFWTPEPLNLPQDALPEAVRQLARLAATSNAFLRSYDARKLYYLLPTRLPDDHPTAQLITVGVNNVEPGLRSLGREGLLEKLRKIEARATELISQGLQPREPDLRVVSHGDYRDGNLLLRRAGDGSGGEDNGAGAGGDESAVPARWEVRVVDWQATMIAHPAVDLIYLLMLSLPRDAMRRLESDVLAIYWEEFSATCRALNSPCPLTRQTLAEDFRRAKFLGLMWCLCMVTLWGKQPLWPDQCIDVAIEVEELGLLEWL